MRETFKDIVHRDSIKSPKSFSYCKYTTAEGWFPTGFTHLIGKVPPYPFGVRHLSQVLAAIRVL